MERSPTATIEKLPDDRLKLVFSTWTENLRSGEFEQGKHQLRWTDGKMCCLGVLCETMKRMGLLDLDWDLPDDSAYWTEKNVLLIGGEDQFIPAQVQMMTGLQRDGAVDHYLWRSVDGETGVTNLTVANDDHGWTFAEIADAVDRFVAERLT